MEEDQRVVSIADLKALLPTVEAITEQFQIVSLRRPLAAYRGIFVEDPLIDVAILGQFKAGKSSFINSILGKAVLPVGVIPVTTAITRIQYGAEERAVVSHFDGRKTFISLDELADYTSEAKNPSNEKNVEVIDITLPSLKPYAGLRLVDTPGLGSVFQYHKTTSENWLPEVGAALLAISADRPLSEHDLQLIRELNTHTPRIILLLTKADLLTPEQRDEVVAFFEKTLKRELNREFPIYLYSTRVDTEQWRAKLDEGLLSRLVANRDREFGNIARHKGRSLARSCVDYLKIALESSLKADMDREELKKLILDEKVNYELIREETFIITRDAQSQTRTMLSNYLKKFEEPLYRKITEELKKEMPTWRGNLWQLTRAYEKWVAEIMAVEMQQISRREHKHFYGTLKKAHASLMRSLEAFRRLLADNLQRALGVSLGEMEWKIDVVEPEHPDVNIPRTFAYHLDLLWFVIPMFIFRRFFERNFLKKIPWEVEVNLSRLASQWEARINKAIDMMRQQAMSYVREEIATIEALLARTQGRTEEIRFLIDKLEKQMAAL
ncbi:MAG: dynamin family protein [Syntrophales bacterium]|nr:dynamin family protein [Syntrophales bacterium]